MKSKVSNWVKEEMARSMRIGSSGVQDREQSFS